MVIWKTLQQPITKFTLADIGWEVFCLSSLFLQSEFEKEMFST